MASAAGADPGLPYRRGVGIMLLNDAGRVLVGKRIDMQANAWQMPQGGIDEHETPSDALWRELKEEVGTDKAALIAEAGDWLTYELPADRVPQLWGGRYRGQQQKWFLLRFTGSDADLALDTHEAEFSAVRWVEPHELPALVVGFKRDVYQKVLKEFAPHLARR